MEHELSEYFDETGFYLPVKNRWLFLEFKGIVKSVVTRLGVKDILVTQKGMEPVYDDQMKKIGTQYEKINSNIDKAIHWKIKKAGGKVGSLTTDGLADEINKLDKGVVASVVKQVNDINPEDVPF
jgi:tyrosine-protein phosphatase YwqE